MWFWSDIIGRGRDACVLKLGCWWSSGGSDCLVFVCKQVLWCETRGDARLMLLVIACRCCAHPGSTRYRCRHTLMLRPPFAHFPYAWIQMSVLALAEAPDVSARASTVRVRGTDSGTCRLPFRESVSVTGSRCLKREALDVIRSTNIAIRCQALERDRPVAIFRNTITATSGQARQRRSQLTYSVPYYYSYCSSWQLRFAFMYSI